MVFLATTVLVVRDIDGSDRVVGDESNGAYRGMSHRVTKRSGKKNSGSSSNKSRIGKIPVVTLVIPNCRTVNVDIDTTKPTNPRVLMIRCKFIFGIFDDDDNSSNNNAARESLGKQSITFIFLLISGFVTGHNSA